MQFYILIKNSIVLPTREGEKHRHLKHFIFNDVWFMNFVIVVQHTINNTNSKSADSELWVQVRDV